MHIQYKLCTHIVRGMERNTGYHLSSKNAGVGNCGQKRVKFISSCARVISGTIISDIYKQHRAEQ